MSETYITPPSLECDITVGGGGGAGTENCGLQCNMSGGKQRGGRRGLKHQPETAWQARSSDARDHARSRGNLLADRGDAG